jgi:hypothetical protein
MALYQKGQRVTVLHGKPWRRGRPIQMHGRVASFDGEMLVLERSFQRAGQPYDGLGATKRMGDFGTIEFKRGAWVCRRRYLRRGGALIGELYNIQTPTGFLPARVRYVDLEIDVAYLPHHPERVMIQDEEELEAAVRRGHIPQALARAAREVAEGLAERLRQWDAGAALDWDVSPVTLPDAGLVERLEASLPR